MALFCMLLLVFLSFLLIGIILLQRGRGGGLAGAFGGAGGQSAFGTRTGDVFTKITIVLAVLWVLMSGITGVVMYQAKENSFSQGQNVPTTITPAGDDVPDATDAPGADPILPSEAPPGDPLLETPLEEPTSSDAPVTTPEGTPTTPATETTSGTETPAETTPAPSPATETTPEPAESTPETEPTESKPETEPTESKPETSSEPEASTPAETPQQ